MKKRRYIRNILVLWIFALFFVLSANKAYADVLDNAGLFGSSELEEIERLTEEVKAHIHMDVLILTTDDALGYETKYFADEVYNGMTGKQYGTGKDYSGFVYTIDMDNREVFIQGYGKAILYLTDTASENIIDEVYPYLKSGEYGESAITALREVKALYDRGIAANQYTYDSETGEIKRYKSVRSHELFLGVGLALITAVLFFQGIQRSHRDNAKHSRALGLNVGFTNAKMENLQAQQDELIHRKQYTRAIQTSTRSTGGGSGRSTTSSGSSGRSFSGSGRGF